MQVLKIGAALVVFVFASALHAQNPTVPRGGILNNAGYVVDGLPGDGVARGSMFAVFGSQLGPATAVVAAELPLRTALGGTSIEITVGGVTRQAFLLVSSAGQLAAVMPSDVPAGAGALTVIVNGIRSQPTPFKVVNSAFGIFSRNQAGLGPAIMQNFVSATETPVNSIFDSAHDGQAGILWGTGLGPIAGSDVDLPPVGNLPVEVELWVGGRRADILYAGRSAQFPGIDQVNFIIPSGVTGCYVPVTVVVGGVASNDVTIAIAEQGRYCSDFQTFLPGELEAVSQSGSGAFGMIEMTRFRGFLNTPLGSQQVAVDLFLGDFRSYTAAQLANAVSTRESVAPLGSCIVTRSRASEDGGFDSAGGSGISGGPRLTLQGPRGMKTIPQDGLGYEAELGGGLGDDASPVYLDPGEYTVAGGAAGGPVGVFQTSLTVPQALQWINQQSFTTVRRDQDLTVQWTGGDPAREFVSVAVQSVNRTADTFGSVYCSAPAGAGAFTIPRRVLATLPASTPWTGQGDPNGLMSVGTESLATSGRINAAGLSGGRFFYALRQVNTVNVQ